MFGFAPIMGGPAERDEALRDFLHEHRGEFIVPNAGGGFMILEVELDRLVASFMREQNALH